jgi:hypothetical protein
MDYLMLSLLFGRCRYFSYLLICLSRSIIRLVNQSPNPSVAQSPSRSVFYSPSRQVAKSLSRLIPILVLLLTFTSQAQQPIHLSFKNSTLASTDSLLPFWFNANRDGKVANMGSFLNLTDLFIFQSYKTSGTALSYTWGVNAVAGFGETNYYQLNRAYAGISLKGWELKGGRFYDPEHYEGLSTTNGNLVRSRNARPHPRLRFATHGYKPMPFIKNKLHFRAEYTEGLLNDNRFVTGTRLHHKSFYLKVNPSPTWELEGGLEHFVMWGGTSPVEAIGKMPSGFKAYLQYITGSSGDETFPGTDQMNVAGNQLGTYQFRATKQITGLDATFYLSHLFEDLSGMNWRNWPDNLLGLHISMKGKDKLITDVVYEYTHTRQQSIRGSWDRQEPDGYFNNGLYQSGYTYHRQVMGSPLFFPVRVYEGISRGIESNMFHAHHLGLKGALPYDLQWKGMFTSVRHYGGYFTRYNPSRNQLSGLLELMYVWPDFPAELGLSVAADAGNGSGRNLGVMVTVAKKF